MVELIKKLLGMLMGGGNKNLVLDLIKKQVLGAGGGAGGAAGGGGGTGGLKDLIEKMNKKGLGDIASSWVSTGKNQAISPGQIEEALGKDELSSMSQSSGLSIDVLKAQLAKLLPKVVDQMTPEGKLPE